MRWHCPHPRPLSRKERGVESTERRGRFKHLPEGQPRFAQGRGFRIKLIGRRIAGGRRFFQQSLHFFDVVFHDSFSTNNARNASSPRRQ